MSDRLGCGVGLLAQIHDGVHELVISRPRLAPDGTYRYPQDTRPMRRYRRIDNNLLFDDMFASFQALAEWLGA